MWPNCFTESEMRTNTTKTELIATKVVCISQVLIEITEIRGKNKIFFCKGRILSPEISVKYMRCRYSGRYPFNAGFLGRSTMSLTSIDINIQLPHVQYCHVLQSIYFSLITIKCCKVISLNKSHINILRRLKHVNLIFFVRFTE